MYVDPLGPSFQDEPDLNKIISRDQAPAGQDPELFFTPPAPDALVPETVTAEAVIPETVTAEAAPEVVPAQVAADAKPLAQKTRKKRLWPKVAALVLVCALVGGAAGVGGALLARQLLPAGQGGPTVIYQGQGTPVVVDLANVDANKLLTPAEVYASNADAVVGITTQVTTNVWGQTVVGAASGSGFVLTADGYSVTNSHVIEDATSIPVQFRNGDKFAARLVGGEADNDVAVLKIQAEGLTPVRLGTSGDLVVGEQVAAIGNPLGEMTFSMTVGYVSALDKPLNIEGSAINVLQTDTAINSGNSGGPLFDMYGQVVGITNAKYSNNGSSRASIEGICFAIPIDDVKDILTDLIEHGYVTGKPYAGVTLSTADAAEAGKYGRSGGAYVQELVPGGPADQAGLQVGDIITAMDDQTIDSWQAFLVARDRHKAGQTVTLTVDRAGQFIDVELTFAEQDHEEAQPEAVPVQPESQTGPYSWDPDAQYGWDPSDPSSPYGSGRGDGGNGYGYDYNFGFDPFSWFGW